MMEPLFTADSVARSFGKREVLRSASIWARTGNVTVLFGRNGSGKSTLIRIATGQLRAHRGHVRFHGETFLNPSLPELARRGLFFLPDRDLLVRHHTLRRHLAVLCEYCRVPFPDELVEQLDLGRFLDTRTGELSGGEARRAEVLYALARKPDCLIADEPLQGISPADGEIIGAAMRNFALAGHAVLITGHEVSQLLRIADEIVWLAAGTTASLGSGLDALMHDQFRREYLGV